MVIIIKPFSTGQHPSESQPWRHELLTCLPTDEEWSARLKQIVHLVRKKWDFTSVGFFQEKPVIDSLQLPTSVGNNMMSSAICC